MCPKWIKTALLSLAFVAYVFGAPILLIWLSRDWRWVQGWIFYGTFTSLFAISLIWMLLKDPALLAERMRWPRRGEESLADMAILFAIKVDAIAWLIVLALDRRFGWTPRLPLWTAACGAVLLAAGCFLMLRSITDNTFLSQVVRIQSDRGQRVVSTGVYGFVRHPMYLGASLLLVGGALLVGSAAGLVVGAIMTCLLVVRIFGEERVLVRGLEGYIAYREKTRYRLIPGVW
ncbi:MAG TPA: isoprenylcysteine carboxylmethyltransferase family protein [Terracidiphilus sp.]|nr:isoprenylcysteine carboxylmethyltransferase family protein [Terracidiphilus sp.]